MVANCAKRDLLGLTAEFDVRTGYLLVEEEGELGKQHRGAYDTYTNTLIHHLGRDEVHVLTRNQPRAAVRGGGVGQDMIFAPRRGDRVVSCNYRELVPPANWLEVDPPGGTQAWNVEGRRLLWKERVEGAWREALREIDEVNPTLLELERGVGGWLSVTYEPYSLCLAWKDAAQEEEKVSPQGRDSFLPSSLGMAIDSRDWGIVCVLPGSASEEAGLTAGSIILKINGESTSSFRAWSLASVFKSIQHGSLPDMSGDALLAGDHCMSLTVLQHPRDPVSSARRCAEEEEVQRPGASQQPQEGDENPALSDCMPDGHAGIAHEEESLALPDPAAPAPAPAPQSKRLGSSHQDEIHGGGVGTRARRGRARRRAGRAEAPERRGGDEGGRGGKKSTLRRKKSAKRMVVNLDGSMAPPGSGGSTNASLASLLASLKDRNEAPPADYESNTIAGRERRMDLARTEEEEERSWSSHAPEGEHGKKDSGWRKMPSCVTWTPMMKNALPAPPAPAHEEITSLRVRIGELSERCELLDERVREEAMLKEEAYERLQELRSALTMAELQAEEKSNERRAMEERLMYVTENGDEQ
ncbi:hypothetical protein GUITHDRAFT_145665, partial [Guillardia theta CCMP2712]